MAGQWIRILALERYTGAPKPPPPPPSPRPPPSPAPPPSTPPLLRRPPPPVAVLNATVSALAAAPARRRLVATDNAGSGDGGSDGYLPLTSSLSKSLERGEMYLQAELYEEGFDVGGRGEKVPAVAVSGSLGEWRGRLPGWRSVPAAATAAAAASTSPDPPHQPLARSPTQPHPPPNVQMPTCTTRSQAQPAVTTCLRSKTTSASPLGGCL